MTFPQLVRQPLLFLAFGFGSGLAPRAPGTFGTVLAVPLFLLLGRLDIQLYLAVVLVGAIAGIYLCGAAAKKLGVHDHGGIVWDEIIGYLITMVAMPVEWTWILAGFLLFRLFDILKPWPIKWVDQRVEGGIGIMLDDILAGLMGWAVLMLINRGTGL